MNKTLCTNVGIEDLEKAGALMPTSPLQTKANEIRNTKVNWQPYFVGHHVSDFDAQIVYELDPNSSTFESRIKTIRDKPDQSVAALIYLMSNVAKDGTIQYIVTMIDDLLQEDKCRVELFRAYACKHGMPVWTPFFNMLFRQDKFITNQTGRIIAKIACWSKLRMEGNDLEFYLEWIKTEMRLPQNEYLQSVARCLQMLLRINLYKQSFFEMEGVKSIVEVLQSKQTFQIQYQFIFCLWIITFDVEIANSLEKYATIPIVCDILQDAAKEKVIRIILAYFRNLLEKTTRRETCISYAVSMLTCKLLKQLSLLEGRRYEDVDIIEDIQYITEILNLHVNDLSSFDEYYNEVKNGRLEWSPVHKSEKFWRENAAKFNDKNYELLKILTKLLENSKEPLVLSVAAHDIGEYVRHYPHGKTVIEQLGGKTHVMSLLSHEDSSVRYEALISVQKIMVHNWEYLGKQLETGNTRAEKA